jgi:rhodanese-related sulfurtransferase
MRILFVISLSLIVTFQSCKNTTTAKKEETTQVVTTPKQEVGKIVLNSPKEVYENLKSNTVQLVDVRTPQEYNEGHVKGALNICVTCEGFESNVTRLDKTKPVYVYCRSGHRSGNASKLLAKMGFKEIHDMEGGILAWEANNLPIEK